MTNPGDQVPYGDDAIPRRIEDVERKLREGLSARSLESSQIGAGGLLINNGGSLTIDGTGTFNTNGVITTAASLSAGTTITAGGAITGASVTATGAVQGATVAASGAITAGSVSAGSFGPILTTNINATGTVVVAGSISGNAITGTSLSTGGAISGNTLRADGGLYSTDAYSFNITGTRVTGWHQIDGHIATASSSERFKTNIVDADLIAKAEAILACQIDYYNYKAEIAKRDDPKSPEYIGPDYQVHTELGMIAERLHEAGLWEFVVYERDIVMKAQTVVDEEGIESTVEVYAGDTLRLDADGEPIPYSIHYEIFSLAVLTATQYLYGLWKVDHAQLEQNTTDIAAIKAKLGI